jgi:hypothetical protein
MSHWPLPPARRERKKKKKKLPAISQPRRSAIAPKPIDLLFALATATTFAAPSSDLGRIFFANEINLLRYILFGAIEFSFPIVLVAFPGALV